ncbi:MAG: lipid biosynthesis B12-binding/radical SAM protein [Candidatus Omnitrophica bacterium]|nr:lipid biosynthesis B12-binding/radical SAM protein [Candidatus Omnitrophota bacterium]
MKVLLISSNVANTPYTIYPLGMSMIASALKNAGIDVEQRDFLKSDRSLTVLKEELDRIQSNIVGISIRNIDNVNLMNEQRYIDAVTDIVSMVKKNSTAIVVLGGSGFSIMPELILKKTGADYGIVGEGEELLVEFVKNVEKGILPEEKCIRSKAPISGGKIPNALYDPELMKYYLQSGNVASVQTKRGCPCKCIYCSYPVLEGSKIRARDPEAVVDDIQILSEQHGAKLIFFTDSVFNDHQGEYLKVIREMKDRNVNVPWTAFFTPKGLTDDNLELMKQTGLRAAELGSDAPTDTTLKNLGKSFLFKDIIEANDLFVKHGIAVAHYYMFGCPAETRSTVLEGIENIKSLKNSVSFIFMGIRILPDTPLLRIAQQDGLVEKDKDLLDSVYYLAPGVDKQWLEETLTGGFKGMRNCVFPPDALDGSLQFLHKMGYSGCLWDMLLEGKEKRKRHMSYDSK